ncbi:unnamed protein product [Caenorhabditis angaria]|uniref:Tc1-like transposase DDE domain-containing protein n=1 Tax=Caenorhabditis angaria TaxID=860376 RepID=A0A9P1I7K9_9PELO|nr:unnamed protein product [Caenorhabditis angaria]
MYKIARMGDIDEKRSGPAKGKNKGKRAIVLAILTSDGILKGSEKVIISGENQEMMDYHLMMTAQAYENYMQEMIPLFVAEARKQGKVPVMVIDNSPLHNTTTEKIPPRNANKADLTAFLEKHGMRVKRTWDKKRLQKEFDNLLMVNGGRNAMKKYKVDEWALQNHGCHFLRLPPYHCCFNPIELVWAELKRDLKDVGSTDDCLEDVKRRAIYWLQQYSAEEAQAVIRHARNLEQKIRERIAEKNKQISTNLQAQNAPIIQASNDPDTSDNDNFSSDDSLFSRSDNDNNPAIDYCSDSS